MVGNLEQEFQYYLDNQDELVKKFKGRFIVIKGCQVVGDYDSDVQAVEEASSKYGLGTFLVQKCESGEESYSQVFHSRVAIA